MERGFSQKLSSALPTWIGWQGIRLGVPEGWFLNGFSGNEREGVLQICSPGSLTVEVKWVRSGKASDLRFHLDRYLGLIEREARKRKQRFTGRIESVSPDHLEFTWKADRKAVGMVRRCAQCGCILLAQVSGRQGEHLHTLASQILRTLRDHSEDGWLEWSLYGLCTAVPERFRLETHQLLSGKTCLIFRFHRERLRVERLARAEQVLREGNLQAWVLKWAEEHRWKGSVQPFDLHGHEGFLFEGRVRGVGALREVWGAFASLHRPALPLRAAFWVCPQRNLLLQVIHQSPRTSNLLEQVLERTGCHSA